MKKIKELQKEVEKELGRKFDWDKISKATLIRPKLTWAEFDAREILNSKMFYNL